jgi:hypothetical protein
LRRRAHVALSFQEHLDIVARLMSGVLPLGEGVDTKDVSFLRRYGLGPDEETAALRLETALREIAR